jgi:hypothetical protein
MDQGTNRYPVCSAFYVTPDLLFTSRYCRKPFLHSFFMSTVFVNHPTHLSPRVGVRHASDPGFPGGPGLVSPGACGVTSISRAGMRAVATHRGVVVPPRITTRPSSRPSGDRKLVRASSSSGGKHDTSLPATSLWLATLRAAEGDDVAPAAALVGALQPGSEAATDALDELRSADGGVSGTPLWLATLAARNGAPGAIALALSMVKKGANPRVKGTQGVAGDETTPLWWACAAVEAGAGVGGVGLAEELLKAGADVDAEGTYDTVRGPPLLWAAVAVRNGETESGLALAKALLEAKADPNKTGSYGPTAVGVTPLVLAAQARISQSPHSAD